MEYLLVMAERLTGNQRKAILDRDNNQSQLRHYSEEKGFYKEPNCIYDGKLCPFLQVNHIVPHRAGGSNDPTNLITLKQCEHIGTCPDNRIKNP